MNIIRKFEENSNLDTASLINSILLEIIDKEIILHYSQIKMNSTTSPNKEDVQQ